MLLLGAHIHPRVSLVPLEPVAELFPISGEAKMYPDSDFLTWDLLSKVIKIIRKLESSTKGEKEHGSENISCQGLLLRQLMWGCQVLSV